MVRLHRTFTSDRYHPGTWMVDGYGLMLIPTGTIGDRGWLVAAHDSASVELRYWLESALPASEGRWYPTLRAARDALTQVLLRSAPPAAACLQLPTLRPVASGRWETLEGDVAIRRLQERWELERSQLALGVDPELPAWTAGGARSLYEARMLIALLRSRESLTPTGR